VVELLLKDSRVDIVLRDKYGDTPLWWASWNGHHEVVESLIASGRDLRNINKMKGKHRGRESTALDAARMSKKDNVVSLLEKFIANPTQTRLELRAKLGLLAADLFSLTIFVGDNLLQLKPAPRSSNSASSRRFLAIALKLPMELQMVLCHRAAGSMKSHILRKDSEHAFKDLAKILLLSRSK